VRISSRGTISGGPVFWLLASPVIAAYWIIYAVAWCLIRGGMALIDWHAARAARKRLQAPPRTS
jgi:hypothetical protein